MKNIQGFFVKKFYALGQLLGLSHLPGKDGFAGMEFVNHLFDFCFLFFENVTTALLILMYIFLKFL